jgi:glycosyltransferase involved in cell wall biosynthesis
MLSGSRSDQDGHGDARRFYADLDVRTVDFDAALAATDPMDPPGGAAAPMHPSYEDRPGAPDRSFADLDDAAFERQVTAWARALRDAGAADADVLHLHHLTPLHEAAARVAPGVPVVGHLHGTELLMLEELETPEGAARHPHADAWVARLRAWAARCERLVVLSPGQVQRAAELLRIDRERCVLIPNGFDPQRLQRVEVDRAAHWRAHLVDAPRGWRPGGGPGSVAYDADDVAALADGPVVLCVGRFTAVKRTALLVEAFARAQPRLSRRASLVLLGGHPGEWEGEHPADAVQRLGVRDVFLAGWHDHAALPAFLSAADVLALASVREQFGAVLVEAMACGVAPIAVDRFGPSEIVQPPETGWLVEPDDAGALADALVAALEDPAELARRGAAAQRVAHERYAWPALAGRLAEVLDEVASGEPVGAAGASAPGVRPAAS